ncbi:C39 family peptidase [Neobacillus sp. PS3-34]|uniref:C39 family peptidase n=1 Tax=Neobacillus sp. PS3-34 TaxID=3070678 RepID=UPI0027E0C505|nr:C39 family peptidase [Neobacillus sp. PS3-34]WML49424.1 C39 family peptidase [Neobacillus sp. PS3-34]
MKKLYFLALLLPGLIGCSEYEEKSFKNAPETISPVKLSDQKKVADRDDSLPLPAVNNANRMPAKTSVSSGQQPMKNHQMLNVVQINQNPELKYGCEITSTAMMLSYAGVKTNKMQLFYSVKKDPDPLIKSRNGDIIRWGDPDVGFVGDMTGRRAGYAVFDKPMVDLVNRYLPGRAVNLTNRPFDEVLLHVSKGYPVVVWTTGDFRLPDRWESWSHGRQTIRTPLDLHAVVLVGYDRHFVYINDPLSGRKQLRIEKNRFIASWKALKSRAVSYH